MLNGSSHSWESQIQGDLDLSVVLCSRWDLRSQHGREMLLIPVSVKSWKTSLVHGGIRGITGDAGSVRAHHRHRDPAGGSSVPHPDQPCNEQVHVSHHCLHGSSAVGKSFTLLLLSLFSPMIALHELSRGRRGFDIKLSLQIMFFSVPGWLVRDFVSFRSCC